MDFLDDLSLSELKSVGCHFSWSNKGEGQARIASRIDRGIVNAQWLLSLPHVEANYLSPTLSDHSPIVFVCEAKSSGGGRPFRFLNLLASHEQFSPVVQAAWDKQVTGRTLSALWYRLKNVKCGLKHLHVQR